MEQKQKSIPIDTTIFRNIIENDNLYVDKTRYLLSMLESGKFFFLSRPRRFGKSLTVDTLEQIFKGNKELFKGLYIYDKYDFKEYPVIRLSMISVNRKDIG